MADRGSRKERHAPLYGPTLGPRSIRLTSRRRASGFRTICTQHPRFCDFMGTAGAALVFDQQSIKSTTRAAPVLSLSRSLSASAPGPSVVYTRSTGPDLSPPRREVRGAPKRLETSLPRRGLAWPKRTCSAHGAASPRPLQGHRGLLEIKDTHRP